MNNNNKETMDKFPQRASEKAANSTKIPEYNILLIGETGCGKSTTINAFANYLKFSNFEEATAGAFIELVSSNFMLPGPKSGELVRICSKIEDDNEFFDADHYGSSVTQAPRSYGFKCKVESDDIIMRFIDTPGIGDAKGIEKDREHVKQILAFLHNYEQLHGIIFILRAHQNRITSVYRYCLMELLTNLHKSASQNIVFCFTFSRNSFYGPGDGYSVLKSVFEHEFELEINLEPNKNCFFIDNEAFRFLVAKKQNYQFPKHSKASFEQSWSRSVKQSKIMWNQIIKNKPHILNQTISLYHVRRIILELAEPIVRLQYMIHENIKHLTENKNRLQTCIDRKEQVSENIFIAVDDLEMKPLPYPRTVCTSIKCVDVVQFQGQQKVSYKTVCHGNCDEVDAKSNLVGDSLLKFCVAFKNSNFCKICGCDWQQHMHLVAEFITVKRQIIDRNMEYEIKSIDNNIGEINNTIKVLQIITQEFEYELRVIKEIATKFACFLSQNSNNLYNQFMEPYMDILIDEELKKINLIPGYTRDHYLILKSMRDNHKENFSILKEAIDNDVVKNVLAEDILEYKYQLMKLKHCGPQLKNIMDTTDWVKETFKNLPEKELDFTKEKTSEDSKKQNFWDQFWAPE